MASTEVATAAPASAAEMAAPATDVAATAEVTASTSDVAARKGAHRRTRCRDAEQQGPDDPNQSRGRRIHSHHPVVALRS